MNNLLNEMKRRNVFRVGIAYIVGAWLLAQVAELALDSFDAPGWVIKTILLVLALGLPIALFFAWAFELTPEGLKKEKDVDRSQSITQDTGRKLNTFIMSILVIAVGLLLADKFLLQSEPASPTPVEAAVDTNSVAVLPFVDMSPEKDQEYFTDGLTENLLHALAQIRELKVAGRTSSFAFKGLNTDLREIGEQLNVSNILEGSVQKAGGRIRITTQLINAEDGYHLWSETFDRDLNDIFVVQDEIAAAVANALRKNLLTAPHATTATSNDFEAYNAYLLGLSYLKKRTLDDWDRAVDQFQFALTKDPNMALAWAGLSIAYSERTGFGTEFAEGYAQARKAAEKAIELDADLADGYLALAHVQMSYDWDWSGAETSLRRAKSLRPGDPDIFAQLAMLRRIRGDSQGAYEGIEQALEQDPLNTRLLRSQVGMLAGLGQMDEALAKAEFLARATPERTGVYASLAGIHRRSGNLDQALEAAEKEVMPFLRLQHEAILYQRMGDQVTAQEKLQELIDRFGDDVSWQVATVYAHWGNKDETIAALERGIAVRDPGVIYIQMSKTIGDLLQDDPRYDEILKKINLR